MLDQWQDIYKNTLPEALIQIPGCQKEIMGSHSACKRHQSKQSEVDR